ncbi:MAG: gliding motility-associated C-terminal domain-containing protein, partial [Paludibacter sp.]|nr:gliding motility-associated C-terminal domain-containing protein [Paludibacter sp.]
MKNIYLSIIILVLSVVNAYSQESYGGTPIMFGADKQNVKGTSFSNNKTFFQIQKRESPLIDNEREQQKADSIEQENGYFKNQLYGLEVAVNLDFKTAATVEILGDSGKLYLLELTSPSAYALQVYFDAFKIPKGARMFIYDSNRTMFLGSFTHQNNFRYNSFGTQFIPGNSLIIEYYEPNQVEFEAELNIKNLVHSFLRHGPFSYEGSYSCEINVSCPLGDGWDREKRAVAMILGKNRAAYGDLSYYGWCTGAVINNTAQDGKPLFLSANHCLFEHMSNIADWLFLFNHEADNCNDDGFGENSLFESVYGATILSKDGTGSPTTDYLLLDLNVTSSRLTTYNVVYAGWDANEGNAANSPYTVGIHHPSGDVKKISKDTGSPVSINNPNSGAVNTNWQVTWNNGITEGGSSGSPLFNSNHKIIGQLRGGNSFCHTPDAPDDYGKFSKSFIHGNFAQWLDPYNTGATSIGAYNPSMLNENCYNGVKDGTETGVDCGGNCPPCNSQSNTCNNGVQDGNETGVDCGGDCRPCGSIEQCNDCKMNGDETFVDCGGSCKPCNMNCSLNYKYYLNGAETLPSSTVVKDFIEVKGGYTAVEPNQEVYLRAGNYVLLEVGFIAKEGSEFVATTGDCDCVQPCGVYGSTVSTPNGDGVNDSFCVIVVGYDRFVCNIYNRWGNNIHSSSGNVYDNKACLWSGGNSSSGAYYYVMTFYNQCSGASREYSGYINLLRSNVNAEDANQLKMYNLFDIPIDLIEIDNTPSNMRIYPNPTND